MKAALGEPVGELSMPVYDGYWYQQMLHSDHDGVFAGMEYAPGFRDAHVAEEQLWVELGQKVEAFSAANHAFGSVFMKFDSQEELDEFRANPGESMRARVI